jgi:hypothetical protein
MKRLAFWVLVGGVLATIASITPRFFKFGCGIPIMGTALGGLLWSIYAFVCPGSLALSLGAVAVAMIAGWTSIYVLWTFLQGVSG